MTVNGYPLGLLERALDQAGVVIVAVRPEQAGLPTPCRSWDVRALVDHVVDEVRQFAFVTDGDARVAPDPDAIGADWAGAYRAAAAELLAAWRRPGALDRAQRMPFGEISAQWAVGQQITELAVHAWDIARAAGQSTDLDAEIAQAALRWGTETLTPQMRGVEADGYHIGPEIVVPDDAPLCDRLAAFGGRRP